MGSDLWRYKRGKRPISWLPGVLVPESMLVGFSGLEHFGEKCRVQTLAGQDSHQKYAQLNMAAMCNLKRHVGCSKSNKSFF